MMSYEMGIIYTKTLLENLKPVVNFARNRYLYHDQLPANVVIRNNRHIINYDELKNGTLDETHESIFEPLYVELPIAFNVSQTNIFIFSGSMMAL